MLGRAELHRAVFQASAINHEHGNHPESYMRSQGVDWKELDHITRKIVRDRSQRMIEKASGLQTEVALGVTDEQTAQREMKKFTESAYYAIFIWGIAMGMNMERMKANDE